MDGSTTGISRRPSGRHTPPTVRHASKRANQERNVIAETFGTRRVLDSAGSPALRGRSAIAVQQALENSQPSHRVVVQVSLRNELGGRTRAGKAELAKCHGDGIRNDHATPVALRVATDVVRASLVVELDIV